METHEPPPPRSYIGQAIENVWKALGALLRGAMRTADDSARQRDPGAPGPLIVDREGRPLPRTAAEPAAPAAAPTAAPAAHHRGALVGIAESLERAVLQPAVAAKAAPAVAMAHAEQEAERVEDPFRRQITSA